MSLIATILSFLVVLCGLIFFHELGHYLVARRNGIAVEEFGIFGFPPRMAKLFTYQGTLFSINWIPLGAFVRMRGEDAADLSPGSFNAASAGARAAVLFAGPAMNAFLAVLLFAASFMAGFPAPAATPQIQEVAPGSLASSLGLQPGDILLQVGDTPVQVSAVPGFDFPIKERGRTGPELTALTIMRQNAVQVVSLPAGAGVDEVLRGIHYTPVLTTRIVSVAPGSPAETAGLQPQDVAYKVNDAVVTPQSPLNYMVGQYLGHEMELTVLRGEQWVSVNLVPRLDPPPGEGAMGIGIEQVSALGVLSLPRALWEGLLTTGEYILLVLQLPVMLLLGQLSPSDAGITGPVGIAQMMGGAVTATIDTGLWYPVWRLAAIISAGLAIANLLPIPALDGGRLFFILVEKLRGRRLQPEQEGLIHMIGFALLLGLMVLVTAQDITSGTQSVNWLQILGQ